MRVRIFFLFVVRSIYLRGAFLPGFLWDEGSHICIYDSFVLRFLKRFPVEMKGNGVALVLIPSIPNYEASASEVDNR